MNERIPDLSLLEPKIPLCFCCDRVLSFFFFYFCCCLFFRHGLEFGFRLATNSQQTSYLESQILRVQIPWPLYLFPSPSCQFFVLSSLCSPDSTETCYVDRLNWSQTQRPSFLHIWSTGVKGVCYNIVTSPYLDFFHGKSGSGLFSCMGMLMYAHRCGSQRWAKGPVSFTGCYHFVS